MKQSQLAKFVFILCAASSCFLAAEARGEGFWERFKLDYYRNKCWPDPFRQADRQAAVDPFAIMKDNGWRIHNTLHDPFFDREKQTLNRAGEMKVRWIATQAPMARRTVYVLRGETPEITQSRVGSVQDYLSRAVSSGNPPEVLLTDIVPPEGSGEYFDNVDRQFRSSVPSPRLPGTESSSGGGSSSGQSR